MIKNTLFGLLIFFTTAATTIRAEIKKIQNPYSKVEHYTLENGLKIYLSPQKKAKNIDFEIKVDVGSDAEKEGQASLFHTLEHNLFHHDSLPENMTFLQVVKEKGGRANGTTSHFHTKYFTSINSSHGE